MPDDEGLFVEARALRAQLTQRGSAAPYMTQIMESFDAPRRKRRGILLARLGRPHEAHAQPATGKVGAGASTTG